MFYKFNYILFQVGIWQFQVIVAIWKFALSWQQETQFIPVPE